MSADMIEITGLNKCQPLFQEFCKIKGLRDGDFYKSIDYIFWADRLTLAEMIEIIRKYRPHFKMKGCNL